MYILNENCFYIKVTAGGGDGALVAEELLQMGQWVCRGWGSLDSVQFMRNNIFQQGMLPLFTIPNNCCCSLLVFAQQCVYSLNWRLFLTIILCSFYAMLCMIQCVSMTMCSTVCVSMCVCFSLNNISCCLFLYIDRCYSMLFINLFIYLYFRCFTIFGILVVVAIPILLFSYKSHKFNIIY